MSAFNDLTWPIPCWTKKPLNLTHLFSTWCCMSHLSSSLPAHPSLWPFSVCFSLTLIPLYFFLSFSLLHFLSLSLSPTLSYSLYSNSFCIPLQNSPCLHYSSSPYLHCSPSILALFSYPIPLSASLFGHHLCTFYPELSIHFPFSLWAHTLSPSVTRFECLLTKSFCSVAFQM